MKHHIACFWIVTLLMLFVAGCAPQEAPAPQCQHDYRKMAIKDGTCLVNGSIDWQCTLCGEKKVESVPGKHTYTCTDTRPATCASEGLATYTCSGCKETYTEPIAKIDHIFDEGQITTAASCKAEGVKTFTCSGCNATYTEKIAKTEHKYDSGKVTTAATCTTEGVKTFTCSSCGNTKTEKIAKTAHKYDGGKVTTAATCTKEGVKTITCSSCGNTKTEKIAKTAHTYDGGKVTTAATCTKEGVKTITCSSCGNTKTEKIAKTAHAYDAGKVTTAATCTREGVKTITCSSCGNTKTEKIAKASHNWTDATCKSPRTCANCGKTDGAVGNHAYENGICAHCGAEDPNYVPTFGAGQTWVVPGKFEFTINVVTRHRMCSDGYLESSYGNNGPAAVIITYTYKNLGTEKLEINKWNFEVYDAKGTEGDQLYFGIYCKHGVDSQSCITGGSCTAKLPVSLVNDGDSVTIYVEQGKLTGIFNVPVTDPNPEDYPDEIAYSRVKGEITYKYNNYVGTRGDNGAKLLFIPKNTAIKAQDNNSAMMLMSGKYENGIVVKACDGYGRFDTGDEYITAGDFIVLVISKNTTRSAAATADELRGYLGEYISDKDLETLALFIGFSKVVIDDMTLKEGYVHTISHDFGITYF